MSDEIEHLRAALREIAKHPRGGVIDTTEKMDRDEFIGIARAAFEAMIEAWPGMAHYRGGWEPVIHNNRKPHLILPLTENPDDKA